MTATKRVKREVIGITMSNTLTQKGNPTDYWYILECGHVLLDRHSARTAIQYIMLNKLENSDIKLHRFCPNCQYNTPIKRDTLLRVISFFKGRELNSKIIDLFKKYNVKAE